MQVMTNDNKQSKNWKTFYLQFIYDSESPSKANPHIQEALTRKCHFHLINYVNDESIIKTVTGKFSADQIID